MAPNVARRKVLAREGKANKDGSYPTDTPGRAVAAKAYSTAAVREGRMSSSQKASIDARANRELGNKGGSRSVVKELGDRLKARDKR
jgi:hypothetical protein